MSGLARLLNLAIPIISIFGTKQTYSIANVLADSHYRGDVVSITTHELRILL
ncbi:MAG: hypothetical protein DHS20C12_14260 [Pseudohongiella sp.]|nr:MAG: hypothetical protein DHS20C12_14260 [Pseudohongiella sp.]